MKAERTYKKQASRTLVQKKNRTGLPDNLKAGIENLSGYSMDDVRVHYGSSKPAAVQAYAYTQGTDIYVAPGQERHLPHEAWHVVQQMAGRVAPTTEVNGMPVNDNTALENEADVMGEKANNAIYNSALNTGRRIVSTNNLMQMQSYINYSVQSCNYTDREGRLQSVLVGKNATAHLECNDPLIGSAPNPNAHYDLMQSIKKYQGKSYVRGHLMNDHLGGIGEYYNLFPISYKANSEHKNTAEAWAKQALRKEYELWPGNNFASQYYYVNYSVEAVCYSNDLSKNPTVKFICTANRANGGSHTSEIISDAKGYGESRIVGASSSNLHYHNSWSSNNNLYGWSAKGRGESKHTEKSRERSKIFTPYHVMTPLVDNDNIDFLRDMAIEYILESEWDENIISRIVYFLNETTNISDIKKYLPKDE